MQSSTTTPLKHLNNSDIRFSPEHAEPVPLLLSMHPPVGPQPPSVADDNSTSIMTASSVSTTTIENNDHEEHLKCCHLDHDDKFPINRSSNNSSSNISFVKPNYLVKTTVGEMNTGGEGFDYNQSINHTATTATTTISVALDDLIPPIEGIAFKHKSVAIVENINNTSSNNSSNTSSPIILGDELRLDSTSNSSLDYSNSGSFSTCNYGNMNTDSNTVLPSLSHLSSSPTTVELSDKEWIAREEASPFAR